MLGPVFLPGASLRSKGWISTEDGDDPVAGAHDIAESALF
jgi:hypothetical protein